MENRNPFASQQRISLTRQLLSIVLIAVYSALSHLYGEQDALVYSEQIEGHAPMTTLGLEGELIDILENYYTSNFSNLPTWNRLQSLQFSGKFYLNETAFTFSALKKKPNLMRFGLFLPHNRRVIMSFDGYDVWQINTVGTRPGNHPTPTKMQPEEAINFIRDAPLGGNLLYPKLDGKTINYEGIANVEGTDTFHLSIVLSNGQIIESFIDQKNYREIRQITINNVDNTREVTDFSDFRSVAGFTMPFKSLTSVDGRQIHKMEIQNAAANRGISSSIFSRNSTGAYSGFEIWNSPQPIQSGLDIPEIHVADDQKSTAPESFHSFDASILDDSEVRQILNTIKPLSNQSNEGKVE